MHFSATLVAMPQSFSGIWKQSNVVKYAVMLIVGSHGVLYPLVRYAVLVLLGGCHLDRCLRAKVHDHQKDGFIPEANVLFLQRGECIVANGI